MISSVIKGLKGGEQFGILQLIFMSEMFPSISKHVELNEKRLSQDQLNGMHRLKQTIQKYFSNYSWSLLI